MATPGRAPSKVKLERMTVTIPLEDKKRLSRLAEEKGMTLSEVIRKTITFYFKALELNRSKKRK